MTDLELLKQSKAWDTRYNLPLIPMHNNPWIYLAYIVRLLAVRSDWRAIEYPRLDFCLEIKTHLDRCATDKPGYLKRWPDGGVCSHDEILGAAYLNSAFAGDALKYLLEHDGIYNEEDQSERNNIYRFIFLQPALKAFAGYRVGLLSQALYAAHVLYDAFFTKDGETSGILKIWLTYPAMKEKPVSGAALAVWSSRWLKKGFSPKSIFSNYYLTEVPELSQLAREDFE